MFVCCIVVYAESNPALKKLIEVGKSKVEMEFAGLISHACKKLKESHACKKRKDKKEFLEDFRTYAVGAFRLSALQDSSTFHKMFNVITLGNGWSYRSYDKLETILQKWNITDPETQKNLDDYSQLLHSFNVTTSIVDWIETRNLDERGFVSKNSLPPPGTNLDPV